MITMVRRSIAKRMAPIAERRAMYGLETLNVSWHVAPSWEVWPTIATATTSAHARTPYAERSSSDVPTTIYPLT